MSNIVQLVKDFHVAQEQLKAQLKADGEAQLKIVFKEIFDNHPGLKGFAYWGYTPGFNDGDPCYHSGYSAVGIFSENSYQRNGETVTYVTDDFEDNSQVCEFFTGEDELDSDEEYTSINSDCKTLEQASDDVEEVSDVIEMVYDTDYIIKVTLKDDGTVDVDHDYYECGY